MARQFLVSHLQLLEEHSVGAREENLTWPLGNAAGGSRASLPQALTHLAVRERLLVLLLPEAHLALPFLSLRFTVEVSLVVAKMLGVRAAYVEVMALKPHTSFLPSPCLYHFLSVLKLMVSQSVLRGSLPTPPSRLFQGICEVTTILLVLR